MEVNNFECSFYLAVEKGIFLFTHYLLEILIYDVSVLPLLPKHDLILYHF